MPIERNGATFSCQRLNHRCFIAFFRVQSQLAGPQTVSTNVCRAVKICLTPHSSSDWQQYRRREKGILELLPLRSDDGEQFNGIGLRNATLHVNALKAAIYLMPTNPRLCCDPWTG